MTQITPELSPVSMARTSRQPSRILPSRPPTRATLYPKLRFMGSKHRLLPWIHEALVDVPFQTALDGFAGSGAVAYLLKAMGKQVVANDLLKFSSTICTATVQNAIVRLSESDLTGLLAYDPRHRYFIERTFNGIFYTVKDLRFLDRVSWNIRKLTPLKASLAKAALIRSCVKRQPRGVFTVAGDPEAHKDGRRDLQLTIREHFLEQVQVYNEVVFNNGLRCKARCGDIFSITKPEFDLVYLDPPYVPRSDDNCYIKRYHFLEGLSCYWEGADVLMESKVRKLPKVFTPFSYRRTAIDAFERLFRKFSDSIIVLSYSSNGYPDRQLLCDIMGGFKKHIEVRERPHVYHFGTHSGVERNRVREYLIIGR